MRFSLFTSLALGAAALSVVACANDASTDEPIDSSDHDLTDSCTGDYRKVSELVLAGDDRRFGGGPEARSIRALDDNGDGNLDLVVIPRHGTPLDRTKPNGRSTFEIGVIRGDGHGNLAAPVVFELTAHTNTAFTFGDWDGDGNQDVLYQSIEDGWFQVLRLPDGSWGKPRALDIGSACAFKRGGDGYRTNGAVRDVDGDGFTDIEIGLVSADATGGEHARVLLRGSATGLGASRCVKQDSPGAFGNDAFQLRHTAGGDFDGDGKRDIVGYGDSRNLRYVLDLEGAAKLGRLNSSNHNNIGYQAIVGRFDGDAIDDVADLTTYGVSLYYGDKGEAFKRRASFVGYAYNDVIIPNAGDELAGDFNGDGKTDFVFFNHNKMVENGRRLTPTVCSRAGGDHFRYEAKLPLEDRYVNLEVVGDFDNDGKDDLVFRTFDDLYLRNTYWPGTNAPGRIVIFKK